MNLKDSDSVARHNTYQKEYFDHGGRATLDPTGSVYLRRHVQQMMHFAGIRPGDRVLEVGCGLGRYTFILAELGVHVEGLDLSPSLIEQLGEINAGRYDLPVHAYDLVDCPAEMFGKYDAVIGFFVLHHVYDLRSCFSAASKLVRPGGRVAFLEPNPANPLYYLQISLTRGMAWTAEKGMLKMTERHLVPAMLEAGFIDIATHRFGFFPPVVTNLPGAARVESIVQRIAPLEPILPFQLFGGTRVQ
ncbi:MAG: class I SAM-dependent methyltransferase [Actinomycetota bacterium]